MKMDKLSKTLSALIDRVVIGLIIGVIVQAFSGEVLTEMFSMPFESARDTALLIGILTAIIGQFLFFKIVSETLRKKARATINNAFVVVLFGIYYLFTLVLPYFIIFQISKWVATSAYEFLNINQNYSWLVQGIPTLITSIFVISGVVEFFYGRKAVLSKNFYPVDFDAVDQKLVMYKDWQELKLKMRPNDEIWAWCSPEWTWKMLVGREGYMIVRSGRTTRYSITTGMN